MSEGGIQNICRFQLRSFSWDNPGSRAKFCWPNSALLPCKRLTLAVKFVMNFDSTPQQTVAHVQTQQ